jgi:hypothetical protein
VKGLLHTAELKALMDLAALHGFTAEVVTVRGDQCGLATARERVFILLAKAASTATAAGDWQMVLARAQMMATQERGATGYTSVADAIGLPADSPRRYFFWEQHDSQAQHIFPMSVPAPTLRGPVWRRSADRSTYVPNKKDATQDREQVALAQDLTWQELKQVTRFGPDFDCQWPEPVPRGEETVTDGAVMLANAVPPSMSEYVFELLLRAGAFHCLQEQADLTSPPSPWTHKQRAEADAPSEEGESDADASSQASSTEWGENSGAFTVGALQDGPDETRAKLEDKLQTKIATEGKPTKKGVPSGGVALADYKSADSKVNEVLDSARKELEPHMLQIRVDFDGWAAPEVAEVCALLATFKHAFSKDKWDIGECTTLPFRLDLREGSRPVSDRPYRYSPPLTQLIKVEIDKLLAAGIIKPSLSEWASPVVAVLKPDGTARITVNYKKLNARTVVPQMPIPNIEDVLNSLGGSKVFTTMDITSGYFTSAIERQSIPMTAMVTSFGLYEWLRCPQGAAGAPGHFTKLMTLVLQGLERVHPFMTT